MAENQSVKERLLLYLAYRGVGQGRFEKECGLANGYINNIRRSVSPEKLQIIARHNRDLNVDWLLTGEGEMLRKTGQGTGQHYNIGDVSGSHNAFGSKTVSVRTRDGDAETIALLRQQIELLQRQAEQQARQNEQQARMIETLTRLLDTK